MRPVPFLRLSALCAALLIFGVLPATAAATSTQTEIDAAVAKATEYLRAQQEPAGGELSGFGGDWAATALAAAGVNAADVHGPEPGDPSLQDFLLGEYTLPTWDENPPTGTVADYTRSILVSYSAGLDPARLSASSNQPAQLGGRWNPVTGSFGEASTYNTAFAILALRTTPVPTWALAPSVSFLRANQHDDGGWTFTSALDPVIQEEPSEEDITGGAIAALCEAGVPAYDPAVASALDYLRGRLIDGTGGIEYLWGPPNSDTNAWVLSGLEACGIGPQSAGWTGSGGATPVDFLLSLQLPSGAGEGGFGYADTTAANLYSTQDALRALAGGVFAAAPPPRKDPAQPRIRPVPSVAAGTPVPHLLVVGRGAGNVRICKVTAPAGAPLSQVLAAAQAASHPTGCVSSFELAGGEVVAINGVAPEGEDEAWLLRLDRGAEQVAAEQPVGFGQVVALRLGQDPGTRAGAAGAAGASGIPGLAGRKGRHGSRGRRGPKGRPGRNATLACKVRKRRGGKQRVRCVVKHGRAGRA